MTRTAKHPHAVSQREFIESIRKQIDDNPRFFDDHNWSNIMPKGGRHSSSQKAICPDSFYVRPIATHVPHFLFKETPCCPHFSSRKFVNLSSARWINSPKILYDIGSHKHLDTMLYPCNKCKRHFAGCNEVSMGHDSDRTLGFFNMKLSKPFAVDEELCSFVISSWKIPTAQIRQQLEDITTRKCLSDYKHYLHALRAQKIKLHHHEVSIDDRHQETVDRHLREVSTAEGTLTEVRGNMVRAKLKHQIAAKQWRGCIPFVDLLNVKKDNNNSDRMLKKLGKKKLEQLISNGISSGRELLDCTCAPPQWNGNRGTRATFLGWKDLIRKQCSEWKQEVREAKQELDNLEELVKVNEEALEMERQMLSNHRQDEPVEPPKPPLFTKMKDNTGYNARLLSTSRIESILMTDFMSCKKLMQSKMMSQPSKMVKLDFTYKIPGTVNVHKGVGDCFKLHRCMFVLQNEKNQTVHWKCLASLESITAVKKCLDLFCKLNPETVVVVWCDNCCNIREKLIEMFQNAIVLLDVFHWDKRWDAILFDTKSEEAPVFRGLMRRATFHVPQSEHESAKA